MILKKIRPIKVFAGFTLFLAAFLFLNTSDATAAARPGKAHSIGAGLAYPTLNHSLFTNPSALLDSPKTSLQVSYLKDPGNLHGSATFGQGTWGAGLGYRQFGADSSLEEAGLAFQLNVMRLGTALRTIEFGSADVDVSMDFDMNSGRLSVIARDMLDGISRVDLGLGFLFGKTTLGIDVKKPLSTGAEDFWLFDTSLAYQFSSFSVGVGYTMVYDGESFAGDEVHAGISIDATKSVALEAFYNPRRQESFAAGEWALGARFTL